MSSRPPRTRLVVLLVVAAAAIVGIACFFTTQIPDQLSARQVQEVVEWRNVGLGELENQKLADSEKLFDQLATRLPNEPIGPRNLAIGKILALGDEQQDAEPQLVEAARKAVENVKRIEGENVAYHWLSSRVALFEKDYPTAIRHLKSVLQADPKDATAWYALYRVLKNSPEAVSQHEPLEALSKARELSPLNAWLLVEWMREVSQELADEKSTSTAAIEDVREQLEAARPIVQAVAHVIQTHTRVDALALLDSAIASAREAKRSEVATKLRTLANVLLPHASADQRTVLRHPLEFVLEGFSDEFQSQYLASEAEPEAIDVRFRPNEEWDLSPDQLQQLGQIEDIQLADFDLDGRLDLIVLSERVLLVLGRKHDAWHVIAEHEAGGFQNLTVVDLDADFDETTQAVGHVANGAKTKAGSPALANGCPSADIDVILYGSSGVLLLENRYLAESGTRELRPQTNDRLPKFEGQVTSLTPAEIDADGDLDLVLALRDALAIWSNNGDWTFTDITSRSALPSAGETITQLVAIDLNRDVDIDVLVARGKDSGWLENIRHGQLRWRPFAEQFQEIASCTAIEPIDVDGNASWDLLASTPDGLTLVTTKTPATGVIRSEDSRNVATATDRNLRVFDFDNDGFEDLIARSMNEISLLRGRLGGKFEAVELPNESLNDVKAFRVGDIDQDGDLDLLAVGSSALEFIENDGGNKNHWINIALQAQQIKGEQHSASGRVSPFGVGSLLELKAGTRYQAKVVREQATHFGIGQRDQADVIRVLWLNGVPQNIIQPAADMFVCEQQILNTSCPYLYAWNGEKFVFVTDLLWASPLGLQFAEGMLAPAREWEYLKIPGEAFVSRDGKLILQITEELWEAAYFDEVQLIAVDHPEDVDVYSNEKVGPAEMAQYKIHTVSKPRPLVAAVNHTGRNLLSEVAKEDGVYARPYDRKLRQGIAEDYHLELDLGSFDANGNVTLFLTGWMFPSSTSINVALSQGKTVSPPSPPKLLVADGNGGWQEALPYMGFPGGKTKTIAVDLTGLFPSNDHRVRIASSMELCWDHIFFTAEEAPAEVRTTRLKLLNADLHERGYSQVIRDAGDGPEKFLYDQCSTIPKWPPMEGTFTRFGDVRELLLASDDKLLVMGAGDEVTLEFEAPAEPLPPGWKRDYLIYNVGWDKDCNLLTVAGEDSGPLPFRKMSRYPWPPDESVPDSEAYWTYLRTYQTRRQSHAFWQSIRGFSPGSNSSLDSSSAK